VGLLLAAQRHERRRRRPGDGTGSRVALLAQRPNMRRIRAAISAVMPGGGAQRDVAAHVTEPALRARLESVEAVPGRVVVGERKGDGGDAMVDIDELHGLVLTGPGAEAAARAIVISFLAHHSWDAAQVMVATTLAPTLLSTTEGIPGLRVLGMDLLLDRLEAEIRYQREALEQGGQINWRQRLGGPDPLPASLAVIISDGVSPANLDRLATDLEAARDLAVAVLVLGTRPGPLWPEPVEVDSEGGLDAVGTACLGGAACVHMLTRQEADELLAVIAAGRGRETVPVLTDGERDQLTSLARPPSGSGSGVGHITSVAVSSGSPVAVDGTKPPRAVRRVDIRVYGRVRIIVDGREMRELTESGRQVLALLAVCGELSEAQAMLALGGGSDDPVRASRFTVAVRATRASLRDTLGLDANPIVSAGGVFRLNRDLVSSDHERLVAGSEAARHIDDPHRRQELLASATDGLNGEPFAGAEWNWLVDHQERVRNVAVDALTDLAQLEADSDDLEAALETLDRALAVAADPVEAIFQKQILWQYRLGRKDAARDRYRELARQLAVRCDRSPSEETEALMESLRAAPRVVGQ
jgi:DNA-binding SARP family transcriptional activator